MSDNNVRKEIVEIGRRLFLKDYVASNDGNISAKISENEILITPTGVSKGFMDEKDMVLVRLSDGKVLGGDLKPSSELAMHLVVYRNRPDVLAMVHAHPPVATGFSVAGISFDEVSLPEAVLGLGKIELTEYATPTTEQVPAVVLEKIEGSNALLLANHGALTVGDSLMQAYYRMETLEQVARITLVARLLGNENLLSEAQKKELWAIRQRMEEKKTSSYEG